MNEARTYEMSFNKFMDLTKAEFSTLFKGFKASDSPKKMSNLPTDNLPASVDWRKGSVVAVGPVKDQG